MNNLLRRYTVILGTVCFLIVSELSADVAGLVTTVSKRKEKNVEMRVQKDVFQFYTARMTLEQTCRADDPAKQRKGSIGLEFGRIRNGGWSIWNFFGLRDGRKSLLHQSKPEVSMQNIEGTLVSDMRWKHPSGGNIQLRMIQFSNQRDWLFFRVICDVPESAAGRNLTFSMVPGGANWNIRERERVVLVPGAEYNLAKGNGEVDPRAQSLVAGNNYWHEDFGNFIVYEPEKYQRVFVPRTGNFIVPEFTIRPGVKVFYFVLGRFFAMPKAESISRFFNEQTSTLTAQLRSMNWDIVLDPATFYRELKESRVLAAKASAPQDVYAKLSRMEADFKKATPSGQSILLQELRTLRQAICESGLARYK